MPSKTLEDKVDELTRFSGVVTAQMEAVQGSLKGFVTENAETLKAVRSIETSCALLRQQLDELRVWKDSFGSFTDVKTSIALLERETTELKEWKNDVKRLKEEYGKKAWMIVPPLLAALLTAVLTSTINHFWK